MLDLTAGLNNYRKDRPNPEMSGVLSELILASFFTVSDSFFNIAEFLFFFFLFHFC